MSFAAELKARIDALLVPGHRVLLGLAGMPGAGKSFLAASIAEAYPSSVVVPMDGFHLANVELERLGRRAAEGGAGYVRRRGICGLAASASGRAIG